MNIPLEDYLAEQDDTRAVERERMWEEGEIDADRFLSYCIQKYHWSEFDGYFDQVEREDEATYVSLSEEEVNWRLAHDC